MPTENFKEEMTKQRDTIALLVANAVQAKAVVAAGDVIDGQNKEEMIANITIAYRKLEDAAMRFGKAIQASAGGTSPLGGPATPGTATNGNGGSTGIPTFAEKEKEA